MLAAGLLVALALSGVSCNPALPEEDTAAATQPLAEQTAPVTDGDDEEGKHPGEDASEPLLLYVSPDGSDVEGDGSSAHPLGSIRAAVEQMRKGTVARPCEIILMDGDYYMTDTVKLTAQDDWYTSLHIRAQNSGKVRLIGGLSVDASLCQPVTDDAILDRLVDKQAAEKLMMLDLSSVVAEFPQISLYNPMEIYLGDQPLTMSRWPNNVLNEAYLRAESVVSVASNPKEAPMTFTYADLSDRAAGWSEEGMRDLYILSHLGVDWLNDRLKVTSLDPATRTVTTENGGTYGVTEGNRFFFLNIMDEIDVPGESYVDREARIVYFYPYEETIGEIFVATMTDVMLQLEGCQNVTLEGIRFEYTRNRAISARDVADLTIRDCDVMHTSDMAMSLHGTRITVDGCEIGDTWAGGISMSGGDPTTLTSGENVIENCVIHDVNRSYETYKPGIWAESVGMVIRNNTFYNATHLMIKVYTNNARILNNEFYRCVTDSSDMGVIYFGRNPTQLGTEIGYNYFHDNGNTYGGIGQFAIYIDDGGAGAYIHHNVFHNAVPVDAAIRLHGAQYSRIEENLFSDMDSALFNAHWPGDSGDQVRQDEWLLWLCDLAPNRQHDIQAIIRDSGMNSETWENYYKDTQWAPLVALIRKGVDQDLITAHAKGKESTINKLMYLHSPTGSNSMTNNVFLNIDLYDSYTEADAPYYGDGILRGGGTQCSGNLKVEESDFVAYGSDFAFTEAGLAKVRETIPDFENFSMAAIGPRRGG